MATTTTGVALRFRMDLVTERLVQVLLLRIPVVRVGLLVCLSWIKVNTAAQQGIRTRQEIETWASNEEDQ